MSSQTSDKPLCPDDGKLVEEFKKWNKRGDVLQYEKIEGIILDKLENMLSFMDNIIAIQAIFPSVAKKCNNIKVLKPVNYIIKQIAKIYIIMILIYLKRHLVRLRKINKLIKIIKVEYSIIEKNYLLRNDKVREYHEKSLNVLYTEKIKAVIEIVGYFNDLILNLSLVIKRFKLGKMINKLVGFISWIVNIYRVCRDESGDAQNDRVVKELSNRFGV